MKDKLKVKNIVFPVVDQKLDDLIATSLEECGCRESFSDLKKMYCSLKDSKTMYRVPFRGDEKWS